jgi:hypothetical protein
VRNSQRCGGSETIFSDPDSDLDPLWLVKSYGSSFGFDPKYRYYLFHNANNKKAFSWYFKAYSLKKML